MEPYKQLYYNILIYRTPLYIVDSDDYLTKDSIERIVFHYQYIKNNDKFAGVCGMKCFPDGSRIGKEVTWKILKDSWINYWIIKI